jgi:phospholipid/cholesterol/gamma-HCH transport system substrate-binding protein
LTISKELKIGFFFVLAVAILIWGFNFLKGRDLFTKERIFFAIYRNVGGLVKTKPVYISGVKVGQVSRVYFDPRLNGDIIVELSITNDFPIPGNSISRIFSEDLMGSRAVEIILGDSPAMARSGDTLTSDVEATLKEAVNQQILPIKLKAEELISSIDTMVSAIQGVFNKDIRDELLQSIRSIRHTFQNLESATGNIDTLLIEQSGRLAGILYNLDMITRNLKDNNEEVNTILDNFADISDSLAQSHIPQIFDNINSAVSNLNRVTEKIDKGEGTLGMLVNDDKLYKDLEKSAFELSQLLEDVKANPKRYVRFSIF